MADGKPGNQWSELNENAVIDKMLQDANSEYWSICSEYVRYFIGRNFLNLPLQMKEEVVQETILSIYKSLAVFRRQCKLTTWIVSIARNRAIDVLRRLADIQQWEISPEEPREHPEDEAEPSTARVSKTPEEITLLYEQIQETLDAIEVFIQKHAKSRRNRQILQYVLLDGYSHEETAQILGVPAPVIGYVVRSARDYLRQALSGSPDKQKEAEREESPFRE